MYDASTHGQKTPDTRPVEQWMTDLEMAIASMDKELSQIRTRLFPVMRAMPPQAMPPAVDANQMTSPMARQLANATNSINEMRRYLAETMDAVELMAGTKYEVEMNSPKATSQSHNYPMAASR